MEEQQQTAPSTAADSDADAETLAILAEYHRYEDALRDLVEQITSETKALYRAATLKRQREKQRHGFRLITTYDTAAALRHDFMRYVDEQHARYPNVAMPVQPPPLPALPSGLREAYDAALNRKTQKLQERWLAHWLA